MRPTPPSQHERGRVRAPGAGVEFPSPCSAGSSQPLTARAQARLLRRAIHVDNHRAVHVHVLHRRAAPVARAAAGDGAAEGGAARLLADAAVHDLDGDGAPLPVHAEQEAEAARDVERRGEALERVEGGVDVSAHPRAVGEEQRVVDGAVERVDQRAGEGPEVGAGGNLARYERGIALKVVDGGSDFVAHLLRRLAVVGYDVVAVAVVAGVEHTKCQASRWCAQQAGAAPTPIGAITGVVSSRCRSGPKSAGSLPAR
mmetsp:Transcript_36436/g.120097  ORF Transcript_36436/g.120097 Transcript_36436/m.120097 type:complete len:257 (-) Transcript_36436:412-1182(-)